MSDLCSATINDRRRGLQHCAQPAGHYDEADEPDFPAGDEPRGWHRSETDADGNWTTWADWAEGATPHGASPVRPDEEPT